VGPRAGLDGFGEDIRRVLELETTTMDQKLVEDITCSSFKVLTN